METSAANQAHNVKYPKNRFQVAMTTELFLGLMGYDNSVVLVHAEYVHETGRVTFFMEDPTGKYHQTSVLEGHESPQVLPPAWGKE